MTTSVEKKNVMTTFTLVRVALKLRAINVEKYQWWKLQTYLIFCLHWKNLSLFAEELLLRQLSIQSINKFLEKQNSLDLSFELSGVGSSCSQKHLGASTR